ncbi:MAG: hypothetical protein Q8K26_04670 [Candidatus Gracilibacteria bacterium]|nr:hypothetical protein [Candidatus Gracilibacteria bacterium]
MTSIIQKDIIKEYSIGVIKLQFQYHKKGRNLLENLNKYMIKSQSEKKEELASNIDTALYGEK